MLATIEQAIAKKALPVNGLGAAQADSGNTMDGQSYVKLCASPSLRWNVHASLSYRKLRAKRASGGRLEELEGVWADDFVDPFSDKN